MKVSDATVLETIQAYRESVGGSHGPASYRVLSDFMRDRCGADDHLSHTALFGRIKDLIRRGLVKKDSQFTGSIDLTVEGMAYLEENHDRG